MLTEISYYCDKRPEFFQFISDHFKVEFTEKSFNDPNLKVHAIQDGYDIVAVMLMRKKKECYRINFIHVAEKYQRQGYASFLIDYVTKSIYEETKDFVTVITRVKADNLPSLNFFIKAGYKFKTFECKHETVNVDGNITTTIKPAYILTYDYGKQDPFKQD
jgi:ribosomal protein S18 acetylase RimI-like enzyme